MIMNGKNYSEEIKKQLTQNMKNMFVREKVLEKKLLLIHKPYFASISKIRG